MVRGPRWPLLWLAVLLSGCLGPVATPTRVAPLTPGAGLPLPALPVPATPERSVVENGRLLGTVRLPHFRVRYQADDAADVAALPAVAGALEHSFDRLAAVLGDPPTYAIPVQFEHDLSTAWDQTAAIVLYRRPAPRGYTDQITHALTHVFTGYTGYPFFEEGLAVYMAGLVDGPVGWPLNGIPAARQVGAFAGTAGYQPLATAFAYSGLGKAEYSSLSDDPQVATLYLQAGAFAQFFIARDGLPAYRRLMTRLDPAPGAPPSGRVAGAPALESAFRTWLQGAAAAGPLPAPAAQTAGPTPPAGGPAPDAAALLQTATGHWRDANSVRFTITKLGSGEWAAPDYMRVILARPDSQAQVLARGDAAYQHGTAGWTRLAARQTPDPHLAAVWAAIGEAASPAGPVTAELLGGRQCWRATYFLPETPDLDRYQVGAPAFITLWVDAADGRVYRFRGAGYEEDLSDWDAPVTLIEP
ncbi:MAG TPA: hypothetical protein VM536_10415 [Chloroflexia bacterium]|nr:hypothetical protein [Chloroflexia bacterium]